MKNPRWPINRWIRGGHILDVNETWLTELGYGKEEVVGKWFGDFLAGSGPDVFPQRFEAFKSAGETHGVEFEMQRKDGRVISVSFEGRIGHDARNEFTRTHCIFVNITERKQMERERSLLTDTLSASLNEIYIFDAKTLRFRYVNRGAQQNLGYGPTQILQMTPLDIKPNIQAETFHDLLAPLLSKEKTIQLFETIHQRADGSQYPVEVRLQLSDRGDEQLFLAVIQDISYRKKAEAELNALSSHQQALLSAIPDIVMEVDSNKVYTWANQAGYEFFGEDVIGREAAYYFQGEQAAVYETVQPLFDGSENVIYVESWQRRKDGQKRLLAWWCRVLKDHQGNITGGLSTGRDITDQKALEDQLRQAQKMESVGRLAGGVAHDFNNMLAVIIGYTEMAIEQVNSGDPIFQDLQEIMTAARRSANLTRQLLAFARKQTINPAVLDINETISSMIKLLRKLIGENIELAWKPGANTWLVEMDPSQVDQILANLLVNAKDAIKGAGAVIIETDNVVFDDAYCAKNIGFVPGEYVMMAVSDTGIGMGKDILGHLFEPFFTTKEQGKGTGLGLATVYGIVKQNKGFINVYSEPGQGTTFKIYLPRTETAAAMAETAMAEKSLRGNETVLIVEDEDSILKLGVSVLNRYGYAALSAKTPDDALVLATRHDGPIHLLLTDVVMPKMNGKELQEKLWAIRPKIKTLFMSGYTANTIAHHGVLDKGVHFLQKPFSPVAMAEKIREVLDGK